MAARGVSRPKLVGLFVLALALWLLVVGCIAQQEGEGGGGQEESAEEPFTGAFVGDDVFVIDDNSKAGAFLALVAKEPADDGEEDRRPVRAYLRDGESINEWFDEGSAEGTEFDLTSGSGARLLGSLKRDVDSSWVSGQIFLADGTVLGFSAPPTTGIAGLYDVTISGVELSGTSDGGGRLEGRLGDTPQENGLYPVSGTITPPDGEGQDFQAFATPGASGELRWNVLEDGRIKGGPKRGEGAGSVQQGVGI
jgi:hypothetical protein